MIYSPSDFKNAGLVFGRWTKREFTIYVASAIASLMAFLAYVLTRSDSTGFSIPVAIVCLAPYIAAELLTVPVKLYHNFLTWTLVNLGFRASSYYYKGIANEEDLYD